MKATLLILIFATIYTTTHAQISGKPGKDTTIIRICAPSRGSIIAKPLVIVYSHNKTFITDSSLNTLNPKVIKSINVLKDSISTKQYGLAGRNGVIQIYIDDDKYPDAYKIFEKKEPAKQ
jgi:hypothetical protein